MCSLPRARARLSCSNYGFTLEMQLFCLIFLKASLTATWKGRIHVLLLVGITPLVFRTNDERVWPGEVPGGRASALT